MLVYDLCPGFGNKRRHPRDGGEEAVTKRETLNRNSSQAE
jgi:hypothetical protein